MRHLKKKFFSPTFQADTLTGRILPGGKTDFFNLPGACRENKTYICLVRGLSKGPATVCRKNFEKF